MVVLSKATCPSTVAARMSSTGWFLGPSACVQGPQLFMPFPALLFEIPSSNESPRLLPVSFE